MMDFQPPQPKYKQTGRNKAHLAGLVVAGLIAVATVAVGAKLLWFSRTSPIPKSIVSQMPSVVMVPQGQGITVKPGSASYVAGEQLAQFTLLYNGQRVQFSEQPAPAYFADTAASDSSVAASNGAKVQQQSGIASLVQQLNRFAQFDTDAGTVYLTHPAQLKQGQMAVLNAKGTIVYATSSDDLSQQTWQQLFKDVAVLK
jgi:hypothetical protein